MHTLTRRHVIATLTSASVVLCPRLLTAQTVAVDWDDIPTTAPIGMNSVFDLPAGPATVDVSALGVGEVAVIARPSQDDKFSATGQVDYIGVLRRTEAQIAAAEATDRSVETQNPAYLVISLVCPHRGKAVGATGNPEFPFACTDRGSRHSSVFDSAGAGVSGASDDEMMTVPDHTIEGTSLSLA